MKTFPSQFSAESQKRTGAAPLLILRFKANGIDYYISDSAFDCAPWGITTKAWIKSWGQLQEGISGTLDEFKISDFDVTCLNDPDASPNIEYLVTHYNVKAAPVSLYLWFYGISDPPQEMFRGYIRRHPIPDETTVQMYIQDETLRFERTYIGELVDLQAYPEADPDDVGKLIPIPFGTVSKLRALAVNAGIKTSLPANINAAVTAFTLSESGITAGMTITIDDEQIYVGAVNGVSVTSCTRGYNGTLAAAHQKGAVAWEKKTTFDYIVSGRVLDSLPKVYSRIGQTVMDITAICTRYTGKTGNAHASYPGKAVVTIPGYITVSQAIDMLLYDGIGVDDAKSIVDGIGVSDTIGVSDGIAVSDTIGVSTGTHDHGGSPTSMGQYANNTPGVFSVDYWNASFNTPNLPNPALSTDIEITLYINAPNGTTLNINGINITPLTYSTITIQRSYAGLAGLALSGGVGTQSIVVSGVKRTIYYNTAPVSSPATGVAKTGAAAKSGSASKTGSAAKSGTVALSGVVSKTGTVTLSGNSVANTLIGEAILVDVVDALSNPRDVIAWLALTYCNVVTTQLIGILPASYALNGAITDSRRALEWFNVLAFQIRCRFEMRLGVAKIIFRPDTITPVKTLATCRVVSGKKDWSRDETPYGDIINKIDLLFDRDYSRDKGGADTYRGISKASNAQSITDNGVQQRPDMFMCDFITSQMMADSVSGFYISYYAYQHWIQIFKTFLWDADLEYADGVKLGFAGNVIGEVIQARLSPGDTSKSDLVEMMVVI